MPHSSPSLRHAVASGAFAILFLVGCDDPAQLAQDVIAAQGECTQDSLRVSSEACVQMFQRYAEMATEAMHAYVGGVKAMDQALQRMPPANFDTAGLGRAFTVRPDSGATDSIAPGTATCVLMWSVSVDPSFYYDHPDVR